MAALPRESEYVRCTEHGTRWQDGCAACNKCIVLLRPRPTRESSAERQAIVATYIRCANADPHRMSEDAIASEAVECLRELERAANEVE